MYVCGDGSSDALVAFGSCRKVSQVEDTVSNSGALIVQGQTEPPNSASRNMHTTSETLMIIPNFQALLTLRCGDHASATVEGNSSKLLCKTKYPMTSAKIISTVKSHENLHVKVWG